MKLKAKFLSAFVLGFISLANAQDKPADSSIPPQGEPGKCYVKCITPDVWKNEEVKVLVTPEYKKLKVTPAVYETVTEEYVKTPAYKKYKVIPATFTYEKVPYTSKQGRTDLKVIAPKFGKDSETIETKSTYGKWVYQSYPDCKSSNPNDCQYVCWKQFPAKNKTIPTQTVENAKTTDVPVNELKASYTKKILVPAKVEEVTVPEVKATYTWQKLVTPAKTTETVVPAVYKTVTKEVLVKKGGVTVWEEVDCGKLSGEILPINYNLNSAALTAQAKNIIDTKLLVYMKQNPNQTIELSSHTDARGDDASNQDLSNRRAQSVVDYLIAKGINPSRLIAKGYGETQLANHCANGVTCTEAQHRENRRTEFRVVGNK